MKKSGFFLIIIILFGLSLGPLTYFLGENDEMEFPEETDEDDFQEAPELSSFYSEFSGDLVGLDQYIRFEVYGTENDLRGEIESILSEVPELEGNYSVSSPSLTRDIWVYEGEIPVENCSQSRRKGFEVWYHLSPYFDDLNVYRDSKVTMPSEITGVDPEDDEFNQVEVYTENREIESQLIYSQSQEDKSVTLVCPDLIVDSEGNLTEVSSDCVQSEPQPEYDYGVTKEHLQRDGEIIEKNYSLEVLEVEGYNSKFRYEENVSKEELEEIKNLPDTDLDNESKVVSINSENKSLFEETISSINDKEFLEALEEPTKEVKVQLPEEVVLNGENHSIKEIGPRERTINVSMDMEEEVLVEISYKVIYGRLIDLEIL
ncbi:MAG: hypothetical protein ACOCTT_01765 [archaeon]